MTFGNTLIKTNVILKSRLDKIVFTLSRQLNSNIYLCILQYLVTYLNLLVVVCILICYSCFLLQLNRSRTEWNMYALYNIHKILYLMCAKINTIKYLCVMRNTRVIEFELFMLFIDSVWCIHVLYGISIL